MNGRKDLIKEHFLNVAFFIPLGMLVWFGLRQRKWWWALVLGCLVSLLIEVMQLVMKRGMCEFDDVMHNTLGCMIGYGVMKVLASLWMQSMSERKVQRELFNKYKSLSDTW